MTALETTKPQAELSFERALRVAAEMLSRASAEMVTATTVLGLLKADEVRAFEARVRGIAEECGVDAQPRIDASLGNFSVRFERATSGTRPKQTPSVWRRRAASTRRSSH